MIERIRVPRPLRILAATVAVFGVSAIEGSGIRNAAAEHGSQHSQIVDHYSMRPGERILVAQNHLVVGDVFVEAGGQRWRMFDDKAETGLIVWVNNPNGILVEAPWGANVLNVEGAEPEVRAEILGNKIFEMMETGCRPGGCEWVKVSRDP